uniref:Cytochrome c oxidase subunit 5C n=1 Tax=Solanum tuberosum TaxID=4113 RepID=M0ZI66_SOLTU
MAGSHIAHAAYKGPSVVKEIVIGIALGIVAGDIKLIRTDTTLDLSQKAEKGMIDYVNGPWILQQILVIYALAISDMG